MMKTSPKKSYGRLFFNLHFTLLILCKILKATKSSVVIYKCIILLHCQKYADYRFSLHFLFWKMIFILKKKPKPPKVGVFDLLL